MLDLIIKNALLFDGLASPPVAADLGVAQGRVALIAAEISQPAREVIDAKGLWLAPGFIDIHTHYDLELEIAPALLESVRHGVTSVVIGNCSLSLAIGQPQTLADIFQRVETLSPVLIQKWLRSSLSWTSPGEYLNHLNHLPLGVNVAALLGHSALRAEVMGLERSLRESATDQELEEMRRIATEALNAGFAGISIDMVPWHMMSGELRGRTIPSQHADFREYAMLADVCRQFDAVFQVTPNPQRPSSLLDIYRLSLGLGRLPLRITILAALDSVANRRLWRVFRPMLFVLNKLLRCNIRFQTLTEPFTVYSDGPLTPLFEEFASGVKLNDCETREARSELWQAPGFRRRFKEEWTNGYRNTFHRRLELMWIVACPDASLVGKSFTEAARQQGCEPVDCFIELLEKYDCDLRWVSTGANDRLQPRLALMKAEYILPGFTDAGAHVQNLGYYDGALSLLKQAVQTGFLSPEKAISRVTGEAARWFRLPTGVLQEGAKADFILVNPQALNQPLSQQVAIKDAVLDGAPRMVKRGAEEIIEAVFSNGICVFRQGEATPVLGRERLGEVLQQSIASEALLKSRRRNRISKSIEEHPFTDYWDIFVLKHQNPYNIALHGLGVVIFYGLLIAAIVLKNYWLLLLLPASQIVGLIGHRFFERSYIDLQDALFSIRASRSLNKMFFKLLSGSYFEEIAARRARLRQFEAAQAASRQTQSDLRERQNVA
jgi:N-acyl-D-aspartate/D-glutamate deacylase